jgi:RIO-like serine/threonine protein kinase
MKKLSRLQKHVIVTLLAPSAREMTKREFSHYVYTEFFERESRSAQASLSRAYKRLEQRGYLKRRARTNGWKLTPRGEKIALLEWRQERSRYPHIILET